MTEELEYIGCTNETCWEYYGCTKTDCPAYKKTDTECWDTPNTLCPTVPVDGNGIKKCDLCIYRKARGDGLFDSHLESGFPEGLC